MVRILPMKPVVRSFCFSLLIIPTIRVAVLKEIPKITIQGDKLWAKTQSQESPEEIESPAKIQATPHGFKIGNIFYQDSTLQIGSEEEILQVGEKKFKGELEIQRTAHNKLLILNQLPMEDYLVGLVHGEISASWPMEAIKAQVVAARTYAMRQQKEQSPGKQNYDLESNTDDQVYIGSLGKTEDRTVEQAVKATEGEILWNNGFYPAYFHSCCGGETETVERVWGKKEISSSIVDKFCEQCPYNSWELHLSQRELLDLLKSHGLEGRRIKSITAEKYETSPRNAIIIIETDQMSLFLGATEFRRIVGHKDLKSTWFDIQTTPREIIFKGKGFGHGVGLCQWGVKEMASSGKNYHEILDFYYPRAQIRKIY
ncbi:MAG: SpoIID/LytB domain-containing protein [Deltaproteobacteria bacterium]|nr:SpoIID/LytB domain-containing protein [Deltaproteobacteria bacterium]